MKADEAREIADRAPKAISREELALAEILRCIKLAASRGKKRVSITTDDHLLAFVIDLTKVTEPLVALGYTVSALDVPDTLDWRGWPLVTVVVNW